MMSPHKIIALLALIICNISISMCQSLNTDDEKIFLSLINHINDTSFAGCACMLEMNRYSSFLPNQRSGIEYALSIEKKIDSSFLECATISKNDSVFILLNASDMDRIKALYEEWFIRWKNNTSLPQKPLDGTEYNWVNLNGAWMKEVIWK